MSFLASRRGHICLFMILCPSIPSFAISLVRHEQGAAHAADGYARATGKVGVCLATSGPGCHQSGYRHC